MTVGRSLPRPLSEALRSALGPLQPVTLLAAVQSAWPTAVGARIAAAAKPVSERDGVVTVACDSATWAQELTLLAAEIEAKLREQLPAEAPAGPGLRSLRFNARGSSP